MQLKAQRSHYEERFPGAQDHVVLVGEKPVGRLWLCTNEDEIRVLDVAIMPVHRSEGLGTTLMRSVMADAHTSGRVVRLTVRRDNPRAISFYARLGFEVEAEDALNLSMTC
ncbi:MAG TPA: GNAT family N-acetyltransferase [Candidatus Dormibacteraeota bacterium]|nr:GNAT family N-acetyltransferase [Candidatus Dormibacteraeota bacterium]